MALWGRIDQANNAPKYKGVLANPNYVSSGYDHVGPASKIVYPSNSTSAGYNNSDILVVNSNFTTYSNATFALTTNATGYIQSVTKILPGSFSANTTASNLAFSITNSSYGTATGNTTTTAFTATVDQRVAGIELFGNTTTSIFTNNQVVGVYGVDKTEASVASTRSSSKKGGVAPGWNIVRTGTGPVTAVSVTNVGAAFATGETITISNGSANGVLTITSNGFIGNSTSNAVAGNISSVAITSAGAGFDTNTHVVFGFNRELHLAGLTVAGTATGYSNTDTIRVYGNATVAATTNATATFVTNSTGGFVTANITITNIGLFANGFANTAAASTANVRIVVLASNGSNSAGSGATITANVVTSTSGNVSITTLGGRAGRLQYETLVVVRNMLNSDGDAEDTMFPDS